ncbi:MAG: 16S rRNA (adenine(1518)-N(6)/adenine(1519)-N(6))-dimethyltransferase RsmA [Candidatus Omnitrophica bacterium]|nr:16S rRNA (adenine(1518)-N(6)/adenine(1519)-N(6))-dimethyltransferase RsmA [Candidatus Omnitrophota bacterium]
MLKESELKTLFLKHGFKPLKRFGENYLIDGNIKDKIIKEAGVKKGETVLEIGPGMGELTMDLAESAADVYAVEKDPKAFLILKGLTGVVRPNLKIFQQDILDFSFKSISSPKNVRVIGNLPYYITTPIVEYLIRNKRYIKDILITVQKEVADRLLASPGNKDYASISCFVQYHTRPAYIYTIKRTSFYPEPGVDSSLIRLDVLEKPSVSVDDEELFFKIIRGAFNQRRKTVINSLSRRDVLDMPKEELAKILREAEIDPTQRPEHLSLADFARIANAVA